MQLHNTALALEALQRAGVQLQALPTTTGLVALRPEDLVEGDRERTLSLLWAVARTLQLGIMLRLPSLKAEVQRVLARTRVSGRRPLLPMHVSSGGGSGSRAAQQPLAVYMHDELLSTLQEWVQAVCAAYDVTVHNFTTCFGDGVVLCLLVRALGSGRLPCVHAWGEGQRQKSSQVSVRHAPRPHSFAGGSRGQPWGCLLNSLHNSLPGSDLKHPMLPCCPCAAARAQVHYYLPNAVDLQSVFITKQRQQEAARASQGGQQQQQPGTDAGIAAHRPSCSGSEAGSALGVADMLLGDAAAAADGAADERVQLAKGGWVMEFDTSGFGGGAPGGDDEAAATSRGVAANFKAVHRAAKALGCVPEMLSARDFADHGPDERTVILYVAFLCSRLLECSKDDRAAHVIQCAWRQRKANAAGACGSGCRRCRVQ